MLVILTTTYAEKVLVVVGSKIIDRAMNVITKSELARATEMWRQAHFNMFMSGLLQMPHQCAREDGALVEGAPPSASSIPTAHKEFHMDDIQAHIHTTQKVTIPLFWTVNVHGNTDI